MIVVTSSVIFSLATGTAADTLVATADDNGGGGGGGVSATLNHAHFFI